MSKDGKNFEKKAIMDWLNRGNVNCPLTRQPLKPSHLVPNANLRLKINQWRTTSGATEWEDDDTSSSSDTEVEFVGVVQVDEHSCDANNINSRGHLASNETDEGDGRSSNPVDDDLADLLALYNEVLELTSAPSDSMPPSRQARPMPTLPTPSAEVTTDAILGVLVARHAARRTWRPKLFPNKRTVSRKHPAAEESL